MVGRYKPVLKEGIREKQPGIRGFADDPFETSGKISPQIDPRANPNSPEANPQLVAALTKSIQNLLVGQGTPQSVPQNQPAPFVSNPNPYGLPEPDIDLALKQSLIYPNPLVNTQSPQPSQQSGFLQQAAQFLPQGAPLRSAVTGEPQGVNIGPLDLIPAGGGVAGLTKNVGKQTLKQGAKLTITEASSTAYKLRQLGIKVTNDLVKNNRLLNQAYRQIGKSGLTEAQASAILKIPANPASAKGIVQWVRRNWGPIIGTVLVFDMAKDLAFQSVWGDDDIKDFQTTLNIAYRDARLLPDEQAIQELDEIQKFVDSPLGFAKIIEDTPFKKLTLTPRVTQGIRQIGEVQRRMFLDDITARDNNESDDQKYARIREEQLKNIQQIEAEKRETQIFIGDQILENQRQLRELQSYYADRERKKELEQLRQINIENARYWKEQRRLAEEAAFERLSRELEIQKLYWEQINLERLNEAPSSLNFGFI